MALPKALAGLGHEVRVAMPLYRQVDRERFSLCQTTVHVSVQLGSASRDVRVWQSTIPATRVIVYFLEQPALFDREGLYQHQGKDHPDNLERFSCFSQAALAMLPLLGWQPEIVHCHDWQAALACAHLAWGPLFRQPFFASMATVLTIHNLAYQGLFPSSQWAFTQLPTETFQLEGLEFYGQISCLKGGVASAGLLTTVSPTYAQEIQTKESGCGLDGILRLRREDLVGIVNGIDVEEWNPQTDPHLVAPFSAESPSGKALCKQALQQRQGLREQHNLLIGMVQRLAEQKGIDIFLDALDSLMALPIQMVILGSGDPVYHERLKEAAERFPGRLAVNLTFDNALAHQIEAGADAFLMPSRFEPCGLNQMYSMRFGTVPIVRRVGGLADTVTDITSRTSADQTATGFVFDAYTSDALLEAVQRAVAAFRDHALWSRLMQNGMRRDFSWRHSTRDYGNVYERVLAKRLNV